MEDAKTLDELWERASRYEPAAVARLLTLVESDGDDRDAVLSKAHPSSGRAHRIGIAGPPGAGKSTLIAQLAQRFAQRHSHVGVVAVDPSSPRSGGALLGDRVRMNELESHQDIFIRSLASRGQAGGLSLATMLVSDVLDALGYDPILMETIGVGQSEIDVMRKAHTVVLLLLPGAGDAVQLMKAGLLELADILVVNKADREGAQELAVMLQSEIDGRQADHGWKTPVVTTTAYRGEGLDPLVEALDAHAEHLRQTLGFEERRRSSIKVQLRQLVEKEMLERIWSDQQFGHVLDEVAAEVASRQVDVARAAKELARRMVLPSPE
jgi:LAO/AO transport system kinase